MILVFLALDELSNRISQHGLLQLYYKRKTQQISSKLISKIGHLWLFEINSSHFKSSLFSFIYKLLSFHGSHVICSVVLYLRNYFEMLVKPSLLLFTVNIILYNIYIFIYSNQDQHVLVTSGTLIL